MSSGENRREHGLQAHYIIFQILIEFSVFSMQNLRGLVEINRKAGK